MKIYTRQGDGGETQLLGGERVSKLDLRVETCGVLDELNATLGLVASFSPPKEIETAIDRIQRQLFQLGAWVAGLGAAQHHPTKLDDQAVAQLENEIDTFESQLPALKSFLLPGGATDAATLHLARAICRRFERVMLTLVEHYPSVASNLVISYVNRLSDWLFVASRLANARANVADKKWTS